MGGVDDGAERGVQPVFGSHCARHGEGGCQESRSSIGHFVRHQHEGVCSVGVPQLGATSGKSMQIYTVNIEIGAQVLDGLFVLGITGKVGNSSFFC